MEPKRGEVWQEADKVLVVYIGKDDDGENQWLAFGGRNVVRDESLAHPLRRVLDPMGNFVPEVIDYL